VADLFQYACRRWVEVKNRKRTAFGFDLEGIANGAIIPGLASHTEPRDRAALDQRLEKPLLFEGVLRAQHSDLGIV
jgi:hypothetical protein